MVKKEGEVEGITEPTEVEDTPVVEEIAPPTAEEQLATLLAEREALRIKLEQAEKGLNTAQATLTRKDREAKAQADFSKRMDGFESTLELVAGRLLQGDISPEDALSFRKEVAEAKEANRKEMAEVALKAQQDEYATQAVAVFQRAKAAFPDDDTKLFRVERCLDRGLLADAEGIVAKAEKKETKVESEDDLKAKWIAEGERRALEKSGGLITSTSLPSGASESDSVFLKKFGLGDIPVTKESVDRYNKIKSTY